MSSEQLKEPETEGTHVGLDFVAGVRVSEVLLEADERYDASGNALEDKKRTTTALESGARPRRVRLRWERTES